MGRKIDIAAATPTELREFARDTLGMNVPPNIKRENLIAKINAAWDKDHIVVKDDDSPQPQTGEDPKPVTKDQEGPEEGYVRIHIAVTEGAGGRDHVPVSVNGKAMLVPRGKDVDIPVEYYEVLKNAVSHRYDPLEDGGINPVARQVQQYPMQRVA